MSMKQVVLLVLSLTAMLSLVACGEEPDEGTPDGGPSNGDTDSNVNSNALCVDNTEVSDVNTLIGQKFILDFKADYWTKPGGDPGQELGSYTPKFAFEIQTVDAATNTFTAILGTAKNGAQDVCNMTYQIAGQLDSTSGSTVFSTTPLDVQVIIEGPVEEGVKVLGTLRGFTIGGQFCNQGEDYKYGKLSAELDGAEIYELFTKMDPVPDSGPKLCENLNALGVICEECSFEAGTRLCLGVEAALFQISNSTTLTFQEVAATDTSCL